MNHRVALTDWLTVLRVAPLGLRGLDLGRMGFAKHPERSSVSAPLCTWEFRD